MVKHLSAMWETWVRSLGWEDPLEKEMAPQSSILVWKIPWMEEPGGLQSTGSQRVGHDWETSLSLSYSIVLIHNILFIYLSVDGYLNCFHFLVKDVVVMKFYVEVLCESHSVMSDSLWSQGLYSPLILQDKILEWVAIPFSGGSSQPRDQTQVSCIAADSLPAELLYMFSIFLGLYQGVELMAHLVTLRLTFGRTAKLFLKQLHYQGMRVPISSQFHQHLFIFLFGF